MLMAQWAAEAWKRICDNPYALRRYFEKTGCHLGVKAGEADKLVALEQLSSEQHAAYAKDLAIPFNKEDAKVSTVTSQLLKHKCVTQQRCSDNGTLMRGCVQMDTKTFLRLCTCSDLKLMLGALKVKIGKMTKKEHFVMALLRKGWVRPKDPEDEDDDDDDVCDDEEDEEEEEEKDTAHGEIPDDDEVEDRMWSTLPIADDDYNKVIPSGWTAGDDTTIAEGDRVVIRFEGSWSCGLAVAKVARTGTNRKCDAGGMYRATMKVLWTSEGSSSYVNLGKASHNAGTWRKVVRK